jgi:hypothetical protein
LSVYYFSCAASLQFTARVKNRFNFYADRNRVVLFPDPVGLEDEEAQSRVGLVASGPFFGI